MLKVYGIPTCGTVRKALAWLEQRGVRFQFVDLRANPPGHDQIEAWVAAFGTQAMRNTSGASYRALPASKADWSEQAWIEAFAEDAMLIKRPVIEREGHAVQVGFRGTDDEIAQRLGLT